MSNDSFFKLKIPIKLDSAKVTNKYANEYIIIYYIIY